MSGRVVDAVDETPISDATITLVGAAATTSLPDGSFTLTLPRGTYRVAIRAADHLQLAVSDRARLEPPPSALAVGTLDETLLPTLTVTTDVANLQLTLTRAGAIAGRVLDPSGNPVAHAIVRARTTNLRPTYSTDLAETDANGAYRLTVAPGRYRLEATHAAFAASPPIVDAAARRTTRADLWLERGCEIRGRVVDADGKPAGDGAIERRLGDTEATFAPAGRIEPDGTFRWVTVETDELTLRAWPWKSPPTPPRTFSCKDGARFTEIILRTPARTPSLTGTLVDASGAPVPFGFLDVISTDPRGQSQQERADAEGRWEVHDMPPGPYQVTATAPGRGIVVQTISVPRDPLALTLSGTGRIDGTTALASGTFEAQFSACFDALDFAHKPMPIAQEPRIVVVTGGRFTIDDAPACDLELVARWRDRTVRARIPVEAGKVAHVQLALGEPLEKVVRGVVRDRQARPVPHARVHAVFEGHSAAAIADADGAFTVRTFSGAELAASDGDRAGSAWVGGANVDEERVDVIVAPRADQ